MEISVAGPIFTQKKIKGPMGQRYPYSTTGDQNIVVFIHIYGVRSISLLFFNRQDTKYE